MSDIEIGSVWREKTDGTEREVVVVEDDVVWVKRHGMKGMVWVEKSDFLARFELVPDMVNHPPHYKDASGIECIEVTAKMQFCGGNCFKYLYRAGKKGSTVEDLKKAIWYAERAWLGSEQVCDDAVKKIERIARYRTGFIQDAMLEIADENWLEAINAIDRELDMWGE